MVWSEPCYLLPWRSDGTTTCRLETVYVCLLCNGIKHLTCNKILEVLVSSLIWVWYWINFKLLEICVDMTNIIFSPAPVVNIFRSCWWNGIFCDFPSQQFIITWLSIIFKINYSLSSSISWWFILITWLYDAFTVIRAYMVFRLSLQIAISFIMELF